MGNKTRLGRQHATSGEKRRIAVYKPSRHSYAGSTRHRDTQVWNGHPMNGLWSTWRGASRSSKPSVRAMAKAKLREFPDLYAADEMAGIRV